MIPRRRNRRGNALFWMTGISLFLLIGGLAKASEVLGPLSVLIWLAAIAGAAVVLKGRAGEMLLTAVAERDQELPEGGDDPALIHEVDELRAQVAELQERLDFTERLVTREREVRGLNVGGER